jgi:hypothetical protein
MRCVAGGSRCPPACRVPGLRRCLLPRPRAAQGQGGSRDGILWSDGRASGRRRAPPPLRGDHPFSRPPRGLPAAELILLGLLPLPRRPCPLQAMATWDRPRTALSSLRIVTTGAAPRLVSRCVNRHRVPADSTSWRTGRAPAGALTNSTKKVPGNQIPQGSRSHQRVGLQSQEQVDPAFELQRVAAS